MGKIAGQETTECILIGAEKWLGRESGGKNYKDQLSGIRTFSRIKSLSPMNIRLSKAVTS